MQRRSIYSTETHTDEKKKKRDGVGIIEQRMLMRRCDGNFVMLVFGRSCCGLLSNLSSDVAMAWMAGSTDVPPVMSDRQVPVNLHDFHLPRLSNFHVTGFGGQRQKVRSCVSKPSDAIAICCGTYCRPRYRGSVIHVPAQPLWTSLKLTLFAR